MQSNHDSALNGTWLPDPSHYPEQMAPLSATVWFEATGLGLHAAMRELGGPFGGFEARTELGWAYERELEPEWETKPECLREAATVLGERWKAEILPRVHAITAELQRMRPEQPSPDAAVRLLDRMWDLVQEQWRWHFLTVIPAQFAVEMLREAYAELSGNADPLAPYALLDGLETERTEADGTLWRLAEQARALEIEDVLCEYPPLSALERLRQLGRGRVFLHALDEYLLRFGGRSRWHELSIPREVERPEMTLESIRLLLERRAPRAAPGARRQDMEDQTLARFPALTQVLQAAKVGYALKENHVYHIDYPGLLATREVLLGVGRRLQAECRLELEDDIWMLTREELRTLLIDSHSASLDELVRDRRAAQARGRQQGVRPYLGTLPRTEERHAVLEQFYGTATGGSSDAVLRGLAASPGQAEGTARIVLGPQDYRRIQPGDVLVAMTTTPAWTPLFPSLSALVTETGGVLCHAAVVAREYGLPAVVGVQGATNHIADGARVRVDGERGEVMLVVRRG